MAQGSTYDDGTVGSWTAGDDGWASGTAIGNFLDDTNNELYFAQFQCVLGSSSPTFLGESVAAVKDQVAYYVEDLIEFDGDVGIGTGVFVTSTQLRSVVSMRSKRIVPSVSTSGTVGHYGHQFSTGAGAVTTLNGFQRLGKTQFVFMSTDSAHAQTLGFAGFQYSASTSATLLADARH
jgi:hypothetical protein